METKVTTDSLVNEPLKVDLSELMGGLNYLISDMATEEVDLSIENVWCEHYEDLSWEDFSKVLEDKLGIYGVDPYGITDWQAAIREAMPYAIDSFLSNAEVAKIVKVEIGDLESSEDRFLRALNCMPVVVTIDPAKLAQVWNDRQAGATVDIDRSRYSHHTGLTDREAVTVEVLRGLYEQDLGLEGNVFAMEDFHACIGIQEFMDQSYLDKITPEIG